MLIKRADLFLIKNIGDKLKDKVFSIQTQYKLLKLIKIADEEYPIYMEQFQSLLDSYAEKDDQGNIIHSEDGGTKIKKNKTARVNIYGLSHRRTFSIFSFLRSV